MPSDNPMNKPVETIMTTDPITLKQENTLEDARRIFDENHFHHIPIVEKGKLVGIISTFDLMNTNRLLSEYQGVPVSTIMTRKIATLNPTDMIGAASIVLLQNRFQSVPVVDDERNLLGILTTFDLMKYQYKLAYPGDDFPF